MEWINYTTLKELGYPGYLKQDGPEKILQFGEGNFLRAFADYFFDIANEKNDWNGKIVLVQPNSSNPEKADRINRQQGLYTLYLKGIERGQIINEKRIISVVSRCLNARRDFDEIIEIGKSEALEYIISNTTEAGIIYDPDADFQQFPPTSFPAKLTRVLYERFRAGQKGVIILSCELIDHNGKELQKCVEKHSHDWGLGQDFLQWLTEENLFCSTLVDRIVTGGPDSPQQTAEIEKENQYRDGFVDIGEIFGVWIIEGPAWLSEKLPFQNTNLNIQVVPDVMPLKKRKVRILNGAHTALSLGAYLAGENTVDGCMQNEILRTFLQKMIYKEIIPVLPLDQDDLIQFATEMEDRFRNPFIAHKLLSISLNSTAKWRARDLPTLIEYQAKYGLLPPCLTMGFAAYIAFYTNHIQQKTADGLLCLREKEEAYLVQDDPFVLDFYYNHRNDDPQVLVPAVLSNKAMWGQDLTRISGLEEQIIRDLIRIRRQGAEKAFASCIE